MLKKLLPNIIYSLFFFTNNISPNKIVNIITKHIIILNNTTLVIGLPKSYQLIISNIKNVISNDSIAIPITDKVFSLFTYSFL